MITAADVREYLPDVDDYGILDFDAYFEKSRQDIFRRLRIDWWPRQARGIVDISILGPNIEMDESKLTESQFTRACVYHCLAYYVLPQLTKHDPEGDRFGEMIKFYRSAYNEEFELVLRDGIEYDWDGDSTISDDEKQTVHWGRLVR